MPVSTPNKAASGSKPPQTPRGFTRSEICEISTNVALDAKLDLQQICLLTGLTGHFNDQKKTELFLFFGFCQGCFIDRFDTEGCAVEENGLICYLMQ